MLINERGNKDSVEIKDLKKVIEHLTFTSNTISLTRTSKNILRVIMRNAPSFISRSKTSTNVKITSN